MGSNPESVMLCSTPNRLLLLPDALSKSSTATSSSSAAAPTPTRSWPAEELLGHRPHQRASQQEGREPTDGARLGAQAARDAQHAGCAQGHGQGQTALSEKVRWCLCVRVCVCVCVKLPTVFLPLSCGLDMSFGSNNCIIQHYS